MAFKIKADPTFPGDLTIVGQGREQKLSLVFKHMEADAYKALLDRVRKEEVKPSEAILECVESWEADEPLSKESLELLAQQQPGADWAILTGYRDALQVARKGN